MSLIIKSARRKPSLVIGLTLIVAVSLVGCDQTESVNASNSSTVANMTSVSVDNLVFNPIIASGQLSDAQLSCLNERDKSSVTQTAQAFYDQHFTQEELSQLNEFFESPTGKKVFDYGNQQIKMMNGVQVDNPMIAPSEAEVLEVQKFMQSPLGQKYKQVNEAQGEDGLMAAINPIMAAEFERCKVEGIPTQ